MSFVRMFPDMRDWPRIPYSEFLRSRGHLAIPDRTYPCTYGDGGIRWAKVRPITINGVAGGMLEYVPRPTRGDIAAFILDLSR